LEFWHCAAERPAACLICLANHCFVQAAGPGMHHEMMGAIIFHKGTPGQRIDKKCRFCKKRRIFRNSHLRSENVVLGALTERKTQTVERRILFV
jgi:hypothetical protein